MDDRRGDRVEVRVFLCHNGDVRDHREAHPYRGTTDAAIAVEACVGATVPRPLAVLAEAVKLAVYDAGCREGTEEARLTDALFAAADAYAGYWDAKDAPAAPPEATP